MPRLSSLLSALALLTAAATSAQAGEVQVRYVQPERFTDAGRGVEAERVQARLNDIFKRLAERHLPPQQTLQVDVLDVDLAGETLPARRAGAEVRVLKGGADWPRMSLKFSLREGDREISSGRERLSDMTYLMRGGAMIANRAELPYEARMLEDWFRTRFGDAGGAAKSASYRAR